MALVTKLELDRPHACSACIIFSFLSLFYFALHHCGGLIVAWIKFHVRISNAGNETQLNARSLSMIRGARIKNLRCGLRLIDTLWRKRQRWLYILTWFDGELIISRSQSRSFESHYATFILAASVVSRSRKVRQPFLVYDLEIFFPSACSLNHAHKT